MFHYVYRCRLFNMPSVQQHQPISIFQADKPSNEICEQNAKEICEQNAKEMGKHVVYKQMKKYLTELIGDKMPSSEISPPSKKLEGRLLCPSRTQSDLEQLFGVLMCRHRSLHQGCDITTTLLKES